jgi:hypothetical protein
VLTLFQFPQTFLTNPSKRRIPTVITDTLIVQTSSLQGCIFFYNPPPPWGGGKESKGLRAREENQRVEKMERQREKKRTFSVGNS